MGQLLSMHPPTDDDSDESDAPDGGGDAAEGAWDDSAADDEDDEDAQAERESPFRAAAPRSDADALELLSQLSALVLGQFVRRQCAVLAQFIRQGIGPVCSA